ncbi:hypothetical protein, partial [Muricoccus vinaceus]
MSALIFRDGSEPELRGSSQPPDLRVPVGQEPGRFSGGSPPPRGSALRAADLGVAGALLLLTLPLSL